MNSSTDNGPLAQRLSAAKEYARNVAPGIRRHYDTRLAVERKTDQSPVTIADREAEWQLREMIRTAFPDDSIVGEEHGTIDGSSAYRWTLDPIDGTKSFISGIPFFGTMIGILEHDEPVAGVIEFPALDQRIYAARGQGAWWQDRDQPWQAARVSTTTSLDQGLYVTSEVKSFTQRAALAVHQRLEQQAWVTRTWGDCYGYFLVATGRAVVMVDPVLNVWDAAPLLPIIEEAGGSYTDWAGTSNVAAGHAIGSNRLVHQQVLEITRPFAR